MVNETVLLALLLVEPKHGYRLMEEADRAIGPDETFDTKRLYSTLRRLEERGAVVSHQEPSPSRGAPPRKVYEITPGGFALLGELVSDPKNALDRRRFFLSVSLWTFVPPATRQMLLARRREWLDAEQQHMETMAALPDQTNWSRAVAEFQLREVAQERAWLDSLDEEMATGDAHDRG